MSPASNNAETAPPPSLLRRVIVGIERVLVGLAGIAVLVVLVLSMAWRDRDTIADLPLSVAPTAPDAPVTVTWFGVTTLLFDDGDTQLLIDGFVSRPSLLQVLLQRPVDNDAATINYFLNEYRIGRLAVIAPVHSHFDHAMDIAAIANRTDAAIVGSASTAAIARGAGVPDAQVVVIEDAGEFSFGEFTLRLIETPHAPIGWRGGVPLAGSIDEPLSMPAPVTAFREGRSYTVIVEHPAGTALIQGSAGFREAWAAPAADVVFLSVGMLSGLGREYAEQYWQALVTRSGADTVIPLHFDDYTQPFGGTRLPPRVVDDVAQSFAWLSEFRNRWDPETALYLPQFGRGIALYQEAEE